MRTHDPRDDGDPLGLDVAQVGAEGLRMIADRDQPEELTADELLTELQAAGITTLPSLKELIENARAHEHQAETRRLQWPLLVLTPPHVNPEVARRAAVDGVLVAELVGGRWFCTVDEMEIWLQRTGRWFKSAKAEQCWREMIERRCSRKQ
jgi:hypothetical protein